MEKIMIDKDSVEKLVVTPQVVVYKNILKDCDKLIKIIENKDRKDSLWPKWEPWYEQGENINQLFHRYQFDIKDGDSPEVIEEKEILKHIADVYDFIQQDYLKDYNENNGKWPTYIKQWDKVRQKLDPIHINIYKYNVDHFDKLGRDGLMLQYHVDEMPEDAHERPWHQVVTITFYLNENYKDGEVCFYDEELNKAYQYKPRLGDATAFPSAAPFYHGVNHFEGNDRYFLRIFIPYSSEGDKEWVEKNIEYTDEFWSEQEKKIDEFVAKYTHAVTLQFPGQKVDKVYGKLVQLDEDIEILG